MLLWSEALICFSGAFLEEDEKTSFEFFVGKVFLSAVLSRVVSNSGPQTKSPVKGTLHKRILKAMSLPSPKSSFRLTYWLLLSAMVASDLSRFVMHCLHKALLKLEESLLPQFGNFLRPDLSSLSFACNRETGKVC